MTKPSLSFILNESRPKFLKLLTAASIRVIVVEQRDRATREGWITGLQLLALLLQDRQDIDQFLAGIFGLSLIIAGLFVTDPSLGYYPAGTSSSTHTLHGTIHGANAPLAFGSLTIALFVLAWRFASDPAWRGWALYTLVAGRLLVVPFIACLVVAILDQKGILPNSPTGLLERIALIIGWGWIALVALRLLRQMCSSISSADSAGKVDAAGHSGQAQRVSSRASKIVLFPGAHGKPDAVSHAPGFP